MACFITICNSTCYYHTFLFSFYICSLERFIFSKSIVLIYLINCFKYLRVISLFLTGQLPSFLTLHCNIPLSFFNLLHSNIKWSTVSVTSVVSLRDVASIKRYIATVIELFKDTARYRLPWSSSHLLLVLANLTPSFFPHVWVHRPELQGQQTLQHVTAACGAYGVE